MSISNERHYQLIEHVGVLGERVDHAGNECRKELNIISWNDRKPLYDIREWSTDRAIARLGIRLNEQELESLTDLLISRRQANE